MKTLIYLLLILNIVVACSNLEETNAERSSREQFIEEYYRVEKDELDGRDRNSYYQIPHRSSW